MKRCVSSFLPIYFSSHIEIFLRFLPPSPPLHPAVSSAGRRELHHLTYNDSACYSLELLHIFYRPTRWNIILLFLIIIYPLLLIYLLGRFFLFVASIHLGLQEYRIKCGLCRYITISVAFQPEFTIVKILLNFIWSLCLTSGLIAASANLEDSRRCQRWCSVSYCLPSLFISIFGDNSTWTCL